MAPDSPQDIETEPSVAQPGAADDVGLEDGESEGFPVRLLLIGAGLAALIVIALVFLSGHGGGEDTETDARTTTAAVTVMRPGTQSVAREISASGSLAARRRTPIGVVGDGGRVVRVLVDAGDWVKKGQTLVMIDQSVQNQQVEGAAAQVEVRQADLALAQNELDRALALVDRGFISKADVDRKRATRDAAQAQLRAARASLAELRARSARLNVYAPASGIILSREVEVGQVVSSGTTLFDMAEGGEMELRAQLSEEDLARISVGTPAVVTPVGTDARISGTIWQVAPIIDESTRQGVARIALPYSDDIRPGGFANAVIRAGAVSAPMLPETALLTDEKGSYVFIVGKDDRVVRQPVTIGLVTEKGVAVTSGLSGNERVVLRAGGFLNPGEKVRPKLVKASGQ